MLESEEIDEEDRKRFKLLKSGEGSKILVIRSLSLLMRLLENYYHKQMILLIDEYDVPIAKASSKGYYQQMLEIIRGMMSTALKDNTSLKFAVITGCLQIAKESIFTGTNCKQRGFQLINLENRWSRTRRGNQNHSCHC